MKILNSVGARMPDPVKKLIEWDGKIPLWGILLLGLAWASWSWNETRELQNRMLVSETAAATYNKKVELMDARLQEMSALRGDINTLKELLIRIERKIDPK